MLSKGRHQTATGPNFLSKISEEIYNEEWTIWRRADHGVFKQAEGGTPVSELCPEHGMSSASFYKLRAKFGGMYASLIAEMKDMATQNRRLKRCAALAPARSDVGEMGSDHI
jgi:putative transposase